MPAHVCGEHSGQTLSIRPATPKACMPPSLRKPLGVFSHSQNLKVERGLAPRLCLPRSMRF